MHRNALYLIIALLLIVSVNAKLVFHETADDYVFNSHWVNPLNVNDTNYYTYGDSDGIDHAFVNVTLNRKLNNSGSPILQLKGSAMGTKNISLAACNNNPVQLQLISAKLGHIKVFCNVSGIFNTIYDFSPSNGYIYEDGYFWVEGSTGNISFTNYIEINGTQYVRLLNYTIQTQCGDFDNDTILIYIDGNLTKLVETNCSTALNSSFFTSSFAYTKEGHHTFQVNSTNYTSPVYNFTWDLYDPNITVSIATPKGSFNTTSINITLYCNDSISPNLTYHTNHNSDILLNQDEIKGQSYTNSTLADHVTNTIVGTCADLFGNITQTKSLTAYYLSINLIDEVEGGLFNLTNLSYARAYLDDNSTYHDFKTLNKSQVNFTFFNYSKLRFEFGSYSGEKLNRYIDAALAPQELRVCVNKDDVIHYEQLIISSSKQPVKVLSKFANCYILADYVRFAYQDYYLLKGYSINTQYELITYDDGQEVILSNLDGSVSAYVNIDILQFNRGTTDYTIRSDALSITKTAPTIYKLQYLNVYQDNEELSLSITNMDTSEVLFSKSNFANKDAFTIYFNYAGENVTNTTMFMATIERTNTAGETDLQKKYFDTQGREGTISAGMAMIFAILTFFFGLTFAATRTTFSFFGIMMQIISIGILALAAPTWYILLFQALIAITIVFSFIVLSKKTYPTIG